MHTILQALLLVVVVVAQPGKPTAGKSRCDQNEVVTKVSVYNDRTIAAECGQLPCGISPGLICEDNQISCHGTSYTLSGMTRAPFGESVVLRCCFLQVPRKIYVGTELIPLASFYEGGAIRPEGKYDNGGEEYEYVQNLRVEQGGVRVWVYRVMCNNPAQPQVVTLNTQQRRFEDFVRIRMLRS